MFLGALADHGLGQRERAIDSLRQPIVSDPTHLAARFVLEWMELETKLAAIQPEVQLAS